MSSSSSSSSSLYVFPELAPADVQPMSTFNQDNTTCVVWKRVDNDLILVDNICMLFEPFVTKSCPILLNVFLSKPETQQLIREVLAKGDDIPGGVVTKSMHTATTTTTTTTANVVCGTYLCCQLLVPLCNFLDWMLLGKLMKPLFERDCANQKQIQSLEKQLKQQEQKTCKQEKRRRKRLAQKERNQHGDGKGGGGGGGGGRREEREVYE